MLARYAIGNIVYYVSDIDRTEAFYRDTLGLAVDRVPGDGPEHGGDFLIAHTASNIDLIFFANPEARPGQSPIIVFTLADGGINNIVSGLAKKGVTIEEELALMDEGGVDKGLLVATTGAPVGSNIFFEKPRK